MLKVLIQNPKVKMIIYLWEYFNLKWGKISLHNHLAISIKPHLITNNNSKKREGRGRLHHTSTYESILSRKQHLKIE